MHAIVRVARHAEPVAHEQLLVPLGAVVVEHLAAVRDAVLGDQAEAAGVDGPVDFGEGAVVAGVEEGVQDGEGGVGGRVVG